MKNKRAGRARDAKIILGIAVVSFGGFYLLRTLNVPGSVVPIAWSRGRVVERDGYVFCDLLPA
jgi:hypothetical protein